ncbi:hypothetical protein [Streptomyces sp. NPDC003032]
MVTPEHIGKCVTDGERVGILREIIPDWSDPDEPPDNRHPKTTAFVRPEGGGCEWTAAPVALSPK